MGRAASGFKLSPAEMAELRRETERDLIAQGLIKPAVDEYQPRDFPTVDPSILAQLDARPGPHAPRVIDQSADPACSTFAQRMQDSIIGPHHGFWMKSEAFSFANALAYECARFEAQRGQWGVVKLLWTYVELEAEPPASGIGSPYDPLFLIRNNVFVRWVLRFSGCWPPLPFPAQIVQPIAMPGRAPWELPYWDDCRYSWALPGNGVFILVPPGMYLHLFAHVIAGHDKILNIGGRLMGYTQPIQNAGSNYNAAHGWNW